MSLRTVGGLAALGLFLAIGAACERSTPPAATATNASPAGGTAAPPRRDPLAGGPYPALFLTVAQFTEVRKPDGKIQPIPGAAKLLIARQTEAGWKVATVEDPASNAFHKAMPWDGGILTIGANQALLKTWRFADGRWSDVTHWNPKFGGKFDRLRDVEQGDVDGDGKLDLVIATHDQGVIAVVHPDQDWRVEEVDKQPDTFVHEIEIGDVDGDGVAEFFATPSKPNKLDQEQPGEVAMYRRGDGTWQKSIVDAPGDTHAKEILAADTDGDKKAELFVVWEGAVGSGGQMVRPVTVKQYRFAAGGAKTSSVVGTVPDRQMRAIQAGDVNGDGAIDLVAGALGSGLWLFERAAGQAADAASAGQGADAASAGRSPDAAWTRTLIDASSSGFEQPVDLADLDGDGALEIYVASEDQHELRQYRWQNGAFAKTVLAPLVAGDITWNVTHGKL